MTVQTDAPALLTLRSLSAGYEDRPITEDVSFTLRQGEILCIAGESGSGKSTLLKAIIGADFFGIRVFSGDILYNGQNLLSQSREALRRIRGTGIGMVFQDPGASFNPIRVYEKQLRAAFRAHGRNDWAAEKKKILDLFEVLNLKDGEGLLKSCPYEMSGGMNQRIAIAAAAAMDPTLLLADEPTSALDVTVQMQIIEELLRIRDHSGMAILLVTHNLGVIKKMADNVIVLNKGRIVEQGDCQSVLSQPSHPYTRQLLAAVPRFPVKGGSDA